MDLIKAHATGEPLAIDLGEGNVRLLAEVFMAEGGIVFADVGWCDPLCSFNPFHYVKGELSGADPWVLGKIDIYKVTSSNPDLLSEWELWLEARAAFKACSRANCLTTIRNGGVDNVDILK